MIIDRGQSAPHRYVTASDSLDEHQRRALHRLDGLDEIIQGHDAAQLMREHNIHLHDEDPWEAGEVDDDHMVPQHEGAPVHHAAHVPLHTSQDFLYRSGLEHYIRHPYTGGGGIAPEDRKGEPHTWEHEGEHWIAGGHHRILADRMTHRNGVSSLDVTNRRLGFRRAARDVPPPYPNPRAEFREGGPEGTHWYHGTDVPFEGALKPTERDYGHASTNDTHWNTDLGVHFASTHDLARDFARNFAGTDSATPEHARIAHASLHMRNPADFENEHELADHAIRTARKHGLAYGETDDPELQDINDGYEDEVSLGKKDHWLNSHPHREAIVHHVEHDLKKAGHDGILYGNSYEGTPGHTSAIAFRDTPVTVHHWEHLHEGHPNYGKEAHRGHEAGKGKPRRDAPDVARRADEAAQGRTPGVGAGGEGDAVGQAPLRALAEHPKVAADLKKLPRKIQETYHARVDDLRRGQAHSSTHALNGPLKGWNATNINFQYRLVHRNVGDELHVLSAGNHDESYDQGIRRKAAQGPLYHGTAADLHEIRPADEHGHVLFPGMSRTDRAYATHDPQQARTYAEMSALDTGGRGRVYEVEHTGPAHDLENDPGYDADVMSPHGFRVLREVPEHELARMPRHGRYTAPTKRLFGPTYGLDTRLWEGDQLKEPIRHDIMATFAGFVARHGLVGHEQWSKIVFFGSEASEWTSKDLHGNDDFDLSIGIEYDRFRAANPKFRHLADADIADGLTQAMHAELNDDHKSFPGVAGTYDQTWFCNLLGWDIRAIRPYGAYDVVTGEWIVRPPHLPGWSMQDFPEGPGLAQEVKGIVEMAQGILKMPEPYRTQSGAALWEFVHSNRSDAFGPNGEGWWDSRNVVEKALDQKGLMQGLFECHRRATENPASLASPVDWSNSPSA